uniref:Uncharacterized protein n=1 Tax=Ascaris lumbricoides TaxID=6252 RepID=A0A9J2PHQ2_ASCLU
MFYRIRDILRGRKCAVLPISTKRRRFLASSLRSMMQFTKKNSLQHLRHRYEHSAERNSLEYICVGRLKVLKCASFTDLNSRNASPAVYCKMMNISHKTNVEIFFLEYHNGRFPYVFRYTLE